ncbi:MAG: hypothetical protein WAU68_04490 [Vitreimonas sp.]
MNAADWRALIEAYLDGRLSAEAFMRRFMEGWNAGGARPPRAIAALQVHVEAFEADVTAAMEDAQVNDDEMRRAAQNALGDLDDAAPSPRPQTFDRARTRDDMRRFTFQMSGCAGAGCLIAAAWVALCLLQIVFVSDYVQHALGLSAWPSAFIGFFLAFVPIVGNILAFLDATQLRGWATWAAAIVFFAAPFVTMLSGWSRWRRYRN